ncbi:NADH-ubiquinone oxidoreductase [Histoplasma capsulatum]|uniref:NADH-ubiquinone oxidoreductase n=1 Tax=Ajellomyces capsulatus TaxID=5037 RepID=A0A8A1M1X4_AJECA|nr:NADH-ubiquinone oxidoreductase 20.8 kDa subunit [Histoplasma mississippiense (nom. inval.)]EDN03868.1 NADH-ubiquinone oxidoreductase 20.8 kDa subunit [Histoplasma mississippiense (nom. inval.)]QSS60458.1 NADH-ubiquinone oxidoreductase [Histoplasma capsulatum]
MSGSRGAQFNQNVLIDTTPMPSDIPKVKEIGATSAPLMSASYFIGDRCRAYNDDYMKCKMESNGKGELDCLREGRKVTRCAASVIKDINENCLEQFKAHFECLEQNNHQLWQCRRPENALNTCVFEKLGLKKEIPDTPKGTVPVHLRKSQIYANYSGPQY